MVTKDGRRTESTLVRDLLDREVGGFQQFFCAGSAQPGNPIAWASAGCLGEAAGERPFAHPRHAREPVQPQFFMQVTLGPVQKGREPWMGLVSDRPFDELGLSAFAMRRDDQPASHLVCDSRSKIAP